MLKPVRARHLPKSAANFKLKGKQKKKEQESAGPLNSKSPEGSPKCAGCSRNPGVISRLESITVLSSTTSDAPSAHAAVFLWLEPLSGGAHHETETGTSAGLTSQQAVLKTERSRMQTMRSRSSPEIRLHSAYHTGHSGLSTTPHHQVCVCVCVYMHSLFQTRCDASVRWVPGSHSIVAATGPSESRRSVFHAVFFIVC